MTLTQQQTLQYIEDVHQGTPRWRLAHSLLVQADAEFVIPLLREAIIREYAKTHHPLPNLEPVLRLVSILSARGDHRSLYLLLEVASRMISSQQADFYFVQALGILEERASSDDLSLLLDLLARTTALGISTRNQVHLATTLVRIAERTPKPELSAALPLLQYTLYRPFEFVRLHKRLRATLTQGTLPIPATKAPLSDASLPLPTREDVA